MSTASTIADYIRHKRSLGIRFDHGATVLSTFSRSVGKMPLRDIRPETITRFINREGINAETMAKQHGVLAGFFRYAVTRRVKRLLAAVPAATGHTRCGIHADTLRTFVLLLYGAGLRRGEARRLKVEDVDLHRSLLHIKETKFFKTRIVPISACLSEVLMAFVAKHHGRRSRDGEDLLFSQKDGTPLNDAVVTEAFRRLRTIAGIKRDGGARNQPRLHDLRHTAAVHRVTSWYRSGADVNDLLPKLATYLGHKNLAGTQHYLTMTEELLAEASRRFEAFARGGCHD